MRIYVCLNRFYIPAVKTGCCGYDPVYATVGRSDGMGNYVYQLTYGYGLLKFKCIHNNQYG